MPRKDDAIDMAKKQRTLHRFLYRYVLPYGGLLLVKLLCLTYRVKIVDPENETRNLEKSGSCVYASWHQRFFPGITFFSHRQPIAIMISQSRDGELIARVASVFGFHPVRGSSTRGGAQALQTLKQMAVEGYKIGHMVDGPQGPFGVVKPGLIRIAQVAGRPILPAIASPERCWVFNSWDRFMVPKPFSRVIIRFGDAIHVPPDLDTAGFEEMRQSVEDRLEALYADTDRIWSDGERVKRLFN